ncbi:MAG TPA: MFS transporter [Casimicrobiaceae bacterium]|nr:MFS transporter [Casimicrobiaceae bacterium]
MVAVKRSVGLLLNVAHALDHMFLLVFATAVTAIAADFGFADWESLMPYGVGAFMLFGLGSLPAGRLGDLWGRRPMMLVFFAGMGVSMLVIAATTNAWQLAGALTLMGLFSSIYHPVGIPMLVRGAARPGLTIGVNGLAGNLGVAFAAVTTGFLVKYAGWRTAFVVPGLFAIGCGIAFARLAPRNEPPPAHGARAARAEGSPPLARIFAIMTIAAISGSLLFNFTTNGNGELLRERLRGVVADPAMLGMLLAGVYVVASFAQIAIGLLIDRFPMKQLYLGVVALQAPLFVAAANASGWTLYALQIAFMVAVFGAIPFTDAMIVRYVDDRMRSRVSGMRLTVSFGVSSAAVWLLGPLVKAAGFATLLLVMAAVSAVTLAAIALLPASRRAPAGIIVTAAPPQSSRAAD